MWFYLNKILISELSVNENIVWLFFYSSLILWLQFFWFIFQTYLFTQSGSSISLSIQRDDIGQKVNMLGDHKWLDYNVC